jgi:hypothetical protein
VTVFRPFFVGVAFIAAALVSGLALQAQFDAQKQSEPPPPARPAGAPQPFDAALPVEVIEGQLFEAARVAAEAERERAEREEAEKVAQAGTDRVRPVVPGPPTSPEQGCAGPGWWIPDWILRAESGCRLDAYNPTGCGRRGCVGAAQLDLGHFAADSPWNDSPAVSGQCHGLDPWSIPDQQECVRRLSNDGTNLAAWGG